MHVIEHWAVKKQYIKKKGVIEARMLRWVIPVIKKARIRGEFIQNGHLR